MARMIIGSDNAKMKKGKRCTEGERDSRISEGKLTSQRGDNICQRLLLLNNLVVVKGKAVFRELQFGFDAAMLLKESLEGVGPEAESMLRTETKLLA